MKISDLKGEKALEVLGDIVEPAMRIMKDKAVVAEAQAGNTAGLIRAMCKGHAKDVIHILAVMEEQDPATYEVGLLTLPAKLVQLLNDPEIQSLFTSPGQKKDKPNSGSPTENTKARKKQGTSSDS